MYLEIEGKAALVTGGSRGIGKAIARELATCGCSVVLTARGIEALNLTDETYYVYSGRHAYNAQYEEYGPTVKFGAKVNF